MTLERGPEIEKVPISGFLFFSPIAAHIVPTGIRTEPPEGPAIPETAIAKSAFEQRNIPSHISLTHCSLTAPWFFNVCSETPNRRILRDSLYTTKDPKKYSDDPATETIWLAMAPPVHDSARARRL